MSLLNTLISSAAKAGGDASDDTEEAPRQRPAQTLLVDDKPKFNPILGLKLLKVLIETNDIPTFQQLDLRHFHEQELEIHAFCKTHLRAYGRLPELETVRSHGHLLDVETAEPASYFIQRVSSREFHSAFQQGQDRLKTALQAHAEPDVIAGILRTQLASCLAVNRSSQMSSFHSLALEVMADSEAAGLHPGMVGIPLGYETLNQTTGGAMPGELVAIVGRPGVGKTVILSEMFMANFAAGMRCLVCSNEMPGKQLVRRLMGKHSGINHGLIKKGEISTFGRMHLHETVRFIENGPETHFITGSFDQTLSALEATVSQFGPDVVFVDAAYLLKTDKAGRNDSQSEKQELIVREMKRLIVNYNIPGITTYQLNRTEKDRPQGKRHKVDLGSIRGTDAVGTDADIVISTTRAPSPYSKTHRIIDCIKARDSDPVMFAINFGFDPPDYSEVPLESIVGNPDDDDEDETSLEDSMR